MPRLMRGFEVEWCSDVPVVDGDADLDAAKMHFRDFRTKPEAMKFAKKIVEEDWFGSVRVTEFELQPYEPGYPGLCREYIADSEYVDA